MDGKGLSVKNQNMAKVELKISGMSCAACSARIEKRLNKVAGVAKASVNLATERANIEYDADKVKTDDLIKIVDDLGYKAERIENISKDREKEQREKEIKKLKAELIASAILSSPLIQWFSCSQVLMFLSCTMNISSL